MPKKWLELAHDKNCYLYPTSLYWQAGRKAIRYMGVKDATLGCWYKNHEFSYLVIEGGLARAGKKIFSALKKDDKFLKKIEDNNLKKIPLMVAAAERLNGPKLKDLSGRELFKRWQDWLKKFYDMMIFSVMGTVMEMEEPILTEYLEKMLEKKLSGTIHEKNFSQHMIALTTSSKMTIAAKEEIDLIKLRLKNISGRKQEEKLLQHLNKYAFIGYGYNGPGWQMADLKKRYNELPKSPQELRKILKEKESFSRDMAKSQKKLYAELCLDEEEVRLFKSLQTLGFWKFERKFYNQKVHLLMEDFFCEIARRCHVSLKQTFMIAPDEMKNVLLKNYVDQKLLNQRMAESVVIIKGGSFRVLTGKGAKKVLEQIHTSLKVDTKVKEIKGNTAFPGKVTGQVKRVDEAKEMYKVIKGDILVSTSTNPQIIAAMKIAGAIVTDSGGITCHAAIVARELKKPCVIGTKFATRVLKDGDIVEVDATNGIVKIIK